MATSTGAAVSTAIVQAAAQGMLQAYSMTDTQGKLHSAAPAAVAAWATAAVLANRVSESSSCSTQLKVGAGALPGSKQFPILVSARAQQACCSALCASQLSLCHLGSDYTSNNLLHDASAAGCWSDAHTRRRHG